jgi:predicted nuclease of predicted toxin-antitoxin system
LRFLVDAQLPPALAARLVELGHEAQHVYRLGLKGVQDLSIWTHAKDTKSVLVTKDEDFVIRRIIEGGGPSIVWVRLGNVRKHVLLPKFESALPRIELALTGADAVIELS